MATTKTDTQLIAELKFFDLVKSLKTILTRFKANNLEATQAVTVAALGATTNLTAIGATFADLAAARTAVNTLKGETEVRLDAIELKLDAVIASLKTAGIMAS